MRNKTNGVRGVLWSGRAGVRELPDPLPPGSGEVEVRIRTASDEREQGTDFSAAWEHGAGPLWGRKSLPGIRAERPLSNQLADLCRTADASGDAPEVVVRSRPNRRPSRADLPNGAGKHDVLFCGFVRKGTRCPGQDFRQY